MPDKFTIEIISPDQTILKQEANEVIIPSFEGQMGILNNHIPLITFLRPGIITIMAENEKKFYVEEGTVEFSNNNLYFKCHKPLFRLRQLAKHFCHQG